MKAEVIVFHSDTVQAPVARLDLVKSRLNPVDRGHLTIAGRHDLQPGQRMFVAVQGDITGKVFTGVVIGSHCMEQFTDVDIADYGWVLATTRAKPRTFINASCKDIIEELVTSTGLDVEQIDCKGPARHIFVQQAFTVLDAIRTVLDTYGEDLDVYFGQAKLYVGAAERVNAGITLTKGKELTEVEGDGFQGFWHCEPLWWLQAGMVVTLNDGVNKMQVIVDRIHTKVNKDERTMEVQWHKA